MSTLYYYQINIGGSKYVRGKSKKETILNTLFECREENLYDLTEKDKEKISTLTKDNDGYEKLFSIIEGLLHTQEELDNIRNSLDFLKNT